MGCVLGDFVVVLFDSDDAVCVVCERRGWPETANTWEPYENLAACYDVIEAFEERYYICSCWFLKNVLALVVFSQWLMF